MHILTRVLCVSAIAVLLPCAMAAQAGQGEAATGNAGTAGTAESELLIDTAPEQADQDLALPSSSLIPYLLRMLLVLALVVAAIYGLYMLLRRKTGAKVEEDPYLRVLGTALLAPGRSVHVVAVGSRAWLVGSAEQAVSLISELEDRELVEAMVKRAEEQPRSVPADFQTILASMLPGRTGTKERTAPGQGFLGRQKDRLRKF